MKLAVTGVGTKPLLLPPLNPPHSAAFTAWFGSGLARDVCEQIKHSPLAFVSLFFFLTSMHHRYETNTRLLTFFFAQSKTNLCWNVHDLSDWRRMSAYGAGLLLKYPSNTLINQV